MASIELPNGVVIKGIPEGTSKEEIMQKAVSSGLATPEDFPEFNPPEPPQPAQVPQDVQPQAPQVQEEIPFPMGGMMLTQGEQAQNQSGGGFTSTDVKPVQAIGEAIVNNQSTVGGVLGGIAGIPLGPGGIITGAAIGSGLGSAGQDWTEGRDIDIQKALTEAAISAGIDIATLGIGKLGKAAYLGIRQALNKGVSPDEIVKKLAAGKSADVGTPPSIAQSQEILNKEGLSLTPFQAGTGTPWDITKEGVARTGFFSKDVFTSIHNQVKDVVRNRMRDIMHIDKSGVSSVTQEDVGRGLVDAFSQSRKLLSTRYGEGMDAISQRLSKETISYDGSLKRAMNKFKKSNLDALGNSTLDKKTVDSIEALEGLMTDVSSGPASFLMDFEKALNKQINSVSDFGPNFDANTARELTQLSKLVRGSVRNQIRKIDPKTARDFRNLKKDYGEGVNVIYPEINKKFIANAGKGAYSALGRMFTLPGSVDNVKAVMRSLDKAYDNLGPKELAELTFKSKDEAKKAISRSYIEQALPRASTADFSIKDFKSVADALTDPTEASRVKAILGKDYEAYKRTVNLMTDASNKPESGLAVLFQRAKEFGTAGTLVAGVASGVVGATGAVATAGAILLGPRVLARIATNPKHVNKLIKIDQMGSKAVSYEDIAAKAGLLLNDVLEEAPESFDDIRNALDLESFREAQ